MSGQAPGQAQQYRVRGGMRQIADRIVTKLGGDSVHTGSPVRQITQDASGVTVSAENVSVKAITAPTRARALSMRPATSPD